MTRHPTDTQGATHMHTPDPWRVSKPSHSHTHAATGDETILPAPSWRNLGESIMSQATDHPTPATPLPWLAVTDSAAPSYVYIEQDGAHFQEPDLVADIQSEGALQDARYAVHAANAYPALVAEVARLREALREIADMGGEIRSNPIVRTIAGKARAALAPPTT